MPDPVVEEIAAPQMNTGAPSPVIAATEGKLALRYYAGSRELTRVRIVFESPRAHYFGPPNDEALDGHPLYRFGLTFYAAHEVHHSRWIEELRDRNRVHHRHHDSQFDGLRHFIWTFHDSTFEVLATSFAVE